MNIIKNTKYTKYKLFFVAAVVLSILTLNNIKAEDKTTSLNQKSFKNNLFIQGGLGFGSYEAKTSFLGETKSKTLATPYNITVGYNYGLTNKLRIGISGAMLKGYNETLGDVSVKVGATTLFLANVEYDFYKSNKLSIYGIAGVGSSSRTLEYKYRREYYRTVNVYTTQKSTEFVNTVATEDNMLYGSATIGDSMYSQFMDASITKNQKDTALVNDWFLNPGMNVEGVSYTAQDLFFTEHSNRIKMKSILKQVKDNIGISGFDATSFTQQNLTEEKVNKVFNDWGNAYSSRTVTEFDGFVLVDGILKETGTNIKRIYYQYELATPPFNPYTYSYVDGTKEVQVSRLVKEGEEKEVSGYTYGSGSKTFSSLAYQVGLGSMYNITNNIGLTASVVYLAIASQKISDKNVSVEVNTNIVNVNLGLNYRF